MNNCTQIVNCRSKQKDFGKKLGKILKLSIFSIISASFNAIPAISQQADIVDSNDILGDYTTRSWSTSEGLPGNTVTDLIQDSHGYINIGTYNGLVKFDGINFTIFNHNTDSQYNFISARTLFMDSKKNIWVGANDEGITLISEDKQKIRHFTKDDGLPGNSVRTICEDLAGNIWIGTAAGVVYLTPDYEKFVIPSGLEQYEGDHMRIVKLFCDSAGRIWLSTARPGGIYYYLNGKFVPYTGIKSIKNPLISTIAQERNGAIWYGINPHYAIRINNGVERLYDLSFGKQEGTTINDIYQDSNSNIWFALDNGIVILHDGILSSYTIEDGLIDRNVNIVKEDREGNIWIGTDRGGIQKLTLSKFKTISLPTAVNAIAEDSKRNLVWVGADDGLYCYDSITLKSVSNKITQYCKNVRVRDVGLEKDGSLLVSTYANFGQLKFSPDGKISMWKDELTGQKVRVSLEAANGDLYVGNTLGLDVIDQKSGKIKRKYTIDDGIPNAFIMALYQDSEENIWVGTDGGGIFILDKEGNIIKNFTKEKDELAGNVIFKILSLSEDKSSSELWICTGTGLSLYRNDKFFNYNTGNGLGIDGVFQVIEDYTETVWFTSNTGISSIKMSQLKDLADGKDIHMKVDFFGKSDGIKSGGITSTSLSMKDSTGRIWFTLIDGFTIYDPVKVMNNPIPPTAELTSIGIDGKTYSYESFTNKQIIMEPSTQRFSLNFTGLSFISPEQMEFCYKLENFDTDFSDWNTTRNVSFTNLKPGSYTFYLKTRTSYEVESPIVKSAIIIKKPYFWQLWYFWFTISFIVLGTIALIIFQRFRRMKRYQLELENTVQERTMELRQSNKQLEIEKDKSVALLLKIFPKNVAQTLTDTPNAVIAERYPAASVLFADIVGFTKLSSSLNASEVVSMLNELFSKFDIRAKNEGIEKIKTIGDCYMAACGLSENEEESLKDASKMIQFAKGILADLAVFNATNSFNLQLRIGINTGALVAGVIGKTKFLYDIWGDTVNVASRMESSGTPGKIHVTEATYNLTKDHFAYGENTVIQIKGKGEMDSYFIE